MSATLLQEIFPIPSNQMKPERFSAATLASYNLDKDQAAACNGSCKGGTCAGYSDYL